MGGSPNALTYATCPKCSATELSFDLVYDSSAEMVGLRAEFARQAESEEHARNRMNETLQNRLAEIKERANLRAREAKREFEAACSQRRKVEAKLAREGGGLSEEDEACLMIQAGPSEGNLRAEFEERLTTIRSRAEAEVRSTRDSHQVDLEMLRKGGEEHRRTLEGSTQATAHRLAVLFCKSCGQALGATSVPADRAEEASRIASGIESLLEATHNLQQELLKALRELGVRLQSVEAGLANLNAREEGRDRTAKVNAAVTGIERLLNGP